VQDFLFALRELKYMIYHPQNFTMPLTAGLLCIIQIVFLVIFELLNIQILFSRGDVFTIFQCYITCVVLRHFTQFHFKAVENDRMNVLKKVLDAENGLVVSVYGKDVLGEDGNLFQRIMRIIYRTTKVLYGTVFFYFLPFIGVIIRSTSDSFIFQ
jgi:hypothetical protein